MIPCKETLILLLNISVPAARAVVWGGGPDTGTARGPAVLTPPSPSRGFATLNPAYNIIAFSLASPVV